MGCFTTLCNALRPATQGTREERRIVQVWGRTLLLLPAAHDALTKALNHGTARPLWSHRKHMGGPHLHGGSHPALIVAGTLNHAAALSLFTILLHLTGALVRWYCRPCMASSESFFRFWPLNLTVLEACKRWPSADGLGVQYNLLR